MSTVPVDLDELYRRNALQAVQRPQQQASGPVAPFQATGSSAGLALPPVGPQTLKAQETKANTEAQPSEAVTKKIDMPATVQSPFPAAQMPAVQAPRGTVEGDENERGRLLQTGSGISQIKNPLLRGLATAGNVIGSVTAPGLMRVIPGTEEHHELLLGQVNKELGSDVDTRQKEALTAEQQAEVPLREAQTEAAKEAPEQKEQAQEDKLTQAYRKLGLDAGGNPIPREQLSEQERSKLEQSDSIQNLNDAREDLARAQAAGEPEKIRLAEERLQQAQTVAQQRLGLQAEGMALRAQGQDLRQQQAQGVLPTTQMRNVAAQAGLVHEQMPALLQEINQMKDEIGPISGRWNEFMQGKIGAPNPEMAGLRSDLLMMSSAVALMHARGRLPENLREEFDKTINAPKQSAENLIATLQHIDKWVEANMNAMGGGKTEQPAAPDNDIDAIVNALKGAKK